MVHEDVAAALELARTLEPAMRLAERTAALDLAAELASGDEPPSSDGPDWSAEIAAERAIDLARLDDIAAASAAARAVLDGATRSEVARARATEALGRAMAWTGTDNATRRADRLLSEAADAYRRMGNTEWAGYAVFWRANAVYLQNGRLRRSIELMAAALAELGDDSPRRATILTFYADALAAVGSWDRAALALDEAAGLAERDDDAKTVAYVAWSRAKLASSRVDPLDTERYVREVERNAGDWFDMHSGVTFLADAAELLDRVGLSDQAARYLERAVARDPADEFVRQARATMLARSGDPVAALSELQGLAGGEWLERRQLWRLTLMSAWATFRAGRDGADELAARAIRLADESGGIEVALSAEPELTRALLPLAVDAGSMIALRQLAHESAYVLRVFGTVTLRRVYGDVDGGVVALPAGQPAELVRLLAVHPRGLSIEAVGEALFPDADVSVVRPRLRQVLNRLRASAADLVVRDGERLVLASTWTDAAAFSAAADRVRGTRGGRAVQLAYQALALWTGSPLPDDGYREWASSARTQLERRHLQLLDVVIADAEQRGSRQEAATAMAAALEHAPYERERYFALAENLLALGRHATAHHLARLAGVELPD